MEKLVARLLKIKDKVVALKLKNQKLAEDLKSAENTISRLKQLIEIQNNTIKQHEQHLRIKGIATQLISDSSISANESRALKNKINEMIKEVDKVIATLQK